MFTIYPFFKAEMFKPGFIHASAAERRLKRSDPTDPDPDPCVLSSAPGGDGAVRLEDVFAVGRGELC